VASYWWYALVGGIAAACTFVGTFAVRAIATRIGFVDEPDERRIHTKTTPNGGGVAMFVAFLVAMIVASRVPALRNLFQGSSEPLGIVLACTVIVAVGVIDDARDMSAPAKMSGQVLAAMILVFLGVTMFWFKLPFAGLIVLSSSVTPLLTALWVIGMTNAVNFIDGLDGLAAGIVAIAAGAIAVYGLHLMSDGVLQSDNVGPLVAVIACGVCLGFLPHNFHPARVFMGDAGALFLGLLMAVATMVIGGRTTDVTGQTYFFFAPLLIPLFILGVPIVDMAFAFVRRTAKRTQFHSPDKDHIHHRLVRLGHGPRRTVVILWAWTALLSGFVLVPLYFPRGNLFIPLGLAVLVLSLYTWFHPGLRKRDPVLDGTNGTEGVEGVEGVEVPVTAAGALPTDPVPGRGSGPGDNGPGDNGSGDNGTRAHEQEAGQAQNSRDRDVDVRQARKVGKAGRVGNYRRLLTPTERGAPTSPASSPASSPGRRTP
jgi:UDP-GlcNAc:undecaprenyl-phosphate GlcNAc-1-phosphate transferase